MRFPRALAIRDDLEISDCLTASSMSFALSYGWCLTGNKRSLIAFVRAVNAKCLMSLLSILPVTLMYRYSIFDIPSQASEETKSQESEEGTSIGLTDLGEFLTIR